MTTGGPNGLPVCAPGGRADGSAGFRHERKIVGTHISPAAISLAQASSFDNAVKAISVDVARLRTHPSEPEDDAVAAMRISD